MTSLAISEKEIDPVILYLLKELCPLFAAIKAKEPYSIKSICKIPASFAEYESVCASAKLAIF